MDQLEYVNANVGKPWVSRAEGDDAFDCWGLVIHSFKKLDGITLPQINGYTDLNGATDLAANEALSTGRYVSCEPCDGAIMAAFFEDKLIHVGRCLCGGVLHATRGLHVRFDKYRVIKATNQRVEYFKYAANNAP